VRKKMYLYKKYHSLRNREDFKKEYNKRYNAFQSIKTGIYLKPEHYHGQFELFYNYTPWMIATIDKVRKNQVDLNSVYRMLPEIAREKFVIDMIADELKSSNDLEGVNSTKEEILETARKLSANGKLQGRMSSMINSYMKIFYDNLKPPQDSNDVRKIYDFITEGEIADADLPDGEIFRKESCYVQDKISGEALHHGIMPEQEIIKAMDRILKFVNGDTGQEIINIAILHYYFGYIHPFYDGNGRTSRFITSLFMSVTYDELTAISVSRGCLELRNKYLKAFRITNDISSHGEMNYFIDVFLELVRAGQEIILDDLNKKRELLGATLNLIEKDNIEGGEQDNTKELLFNLAQAFHFGFDKGMSLVELCSCIHQSKYITRGLLKKLEDSGRIVTIRKKPLAFSISPEYIKGEVVFPPLQ
jgi:Fic family protein